TIQQLDSPGGQAHLRAVLLTVAIEIVVYRARQHDELEVAEIERRLTATAHRRERVGPRRIHRLSLVPAVLVDLGDCPLSWPEVGEGELAVDAGCLRGHLDAQRVQ